MTLNLPSHKRRPTLRLGRRFFLSLGRCDALSDVMCQYGSRKQSLFQALPAVSDTVQLCVSET